MNRKNQTETLNETIIFLQSKRAYELELLKEQFHHTYESLMPINVIKNTFQKVTSSPEIKNNILDGVIGLATGWLSKKVLVGSSHNPVRKLFGILIQFAIAGIVSKHTDTIKSTGANILERMWKHRKEPGREFQHNGNGQHNENETNSNH